MSSINAITKLENPLFSPSFNIVRLASKLTPFALPLRGAAKQLRGHGWEAQREVHTGVDRYPHVFAAASKFVRQHVQTVDRPLRILSFGCSTGEECFSLLSYFPGAEIDGCDINESVLHVAKRRVLTGQFSFYLSSSEALSKNGPYDVIFCMSSLCMFPDANRPSGEQGAFPFTSFDKLVSGISSALRPGGLLVAYNTSYAFSMATAASDFQAVDCDSIVENGFVNKLQRDGRAFTIAESVNHCRCHRVISENGDYSDEDFIHALFWKKDDRGYLPKLMVSVKTQDSVDEVGRYTMSDDDVFKNLNRLLSLSTDIALLRDGDGSLYEHVSSRRRSLSGSWLPPRTYTRMASIAQ